MYRIAFILLLLIYTYTAWAQKRSNIIVDTSEYVVLKDIYFGKNGGLTEEERMFINKLVQEQVELYNRAQRLRYNDEMRNLSNPHYIPYMCRPIAGGKKQYLIRESSRISIMSFYRDIEALQDRIIVLGNYQKAYIVKHNEKGEKLVKVYFYCTDYGREKLRENNIMIVSDGGKCYFDIEVNLTTKKLLWFGVNGVA